MISNTRPPKTMKAKIPGARVTLAQSGSCPVPSRPARPVPPVPSYELSSPPLLFAAPCTPSHLPSQKGEMGDLATSLPRFLISFSDLPRRASCSLVNLALRRLCSSVCACAFFRW